MLLDWICELILYSSYVCVCVCVCVCMYIHTYTVVNQLDSVIIMCIYNPMEMIRNTTDK